jgi:cytochrome c oxidase cbb3-type subunit I/II
VTFYGMATFEGPLLSIRSVNALSHYTDWTIGHVHSSALGWNGLMAAGMFYWFAPRLWKTKLWSEVAGKHAFLDRLWWASSSTSPPCGRAGIMQGLMLSETNAGGATLKYEFLETLQQIKIFLYLPVLRWCRSILLGFLLCAVNIFMTARTGKATDGTAEVVVLAREKKDKHALGETFRSDPVTHIDSGA